MLNLAASILGIALQAGAEQASDASRVPVFSDCDTSSSVIVQAPLDATMHVHYSIAGAPSCYQVTLTVEGHPVQGYVFDPRVDAVLAFERSRIRTEQSAFSAPLYIPPVEAATPSPAKETIAAAKPVPEKKPMPKGPKASM